MFVFFRKHKTWGLIFIVLVSLSFVVFFTPDARFRGRGGGGGRSGDYGAINGKAIHPDEYFQGLKEAKLQFLLRYRSWPDEDATSRQLGYDQMRQAINRVVLIKKLKELQIEATDQAIADQIADYFQTATREASTCRHMSGSFGVKVQPGGISRSDFEEFVRHEVGIQQLISLAGVNGELMTPREAEADYRKKMSWFRRRW